MNAQVHRIGCNFCFRTLDPQDRKPEYRGLLRCTACGEMYHEVCWSEFPQCSECAGKRCEPLTLGTPPPLQPARYSAAPLSLVIVEATARSWCWLRWAVPLASLLIVGIVLLILWPRLKPAENSTPIAMMAIRATAGPAALSITPAPTAAAKAPPATAAQELTILHAAWAAGQYEETLRQAQLLEGKCGVLEDYRLYYLAGAAENLGRYDVCEAAAASLNANQQDSRWFGEACRMLGRARAEVRNWNGAAAAYAQAESALHQDAAKAVAAFERAKCLENADSLQQAAQAYQRCWLEYPPAMEAGRAGQALTVLNQRGITAPPPAKASVLARAEKLLTGGKPAPVVKDLAGFKGDPAADLLCARALVALGKGQEGAAELERLAQVDNETEQTAMALLELCRYYHGSNRMELAVAAAGRLEQRYPKSPLTADALRVMAVHYLDAEQWSDAALWFDRLQKLGQKNRDYALWQLAWLAYNAQDWTMASNWFDTLTAIPQTDYHGAAAYWAGRSYSKRGDDGAAHARWQVAWQTHPRTYYGRLAAERLQGSSAANPAAAPSFPALHDPLADPQNVRARKAAALAQLELAEDAAAELEFPDEKALGDPSIAYRTIQLYASAELFFTACELIDKHFPGFNEGCGANFPADFWTIYYPRLFAAQVKASAAGAGIEPYLALGVVRRESGFRRTVQSPAGAIGLMQLMPATAKIIAKKTNLMNADAVDLFDPTTNTTLGCAHLKTLIDLFDGNIPVAIAAYNMGENRLKSFWQQAKSWPLDEIVDRIPVSHVRVFVKHVLEDRDNYRELLRVL